MNFIPEYYLADGMAMYFRTLYATPDTMINEGPVESGGDNAADKVRKSALYLDRLRDIHNAAQTPGWRLIEQHALDVVRQIEGRAIWDALKEKDQKKIDSLLLVHEAIVQWFAGFHDIQQQIDRAKEINAEYRNDLAAERSGMQESERELTF